MKIKTIAGLACILVMALAFSTQCADNEPDTEKPEPEKTEPDVSHPDISGLSSMEVTREMGAGWNLGNTLDSHWNNSAPWSIPNLLDIEKAWGNPKTTKAMIDKVKEAGFNTVRVPTTWYIFTGPAPDYTIEKRWLDRVQEVVDYVIDNEMFCILNLHHEDRHVYDGGTNGWLYFGGDGTLSETEMEEMKNRMGRLWEQIAARFKDYDEYLIFEALNEPGMHEGGGWTAAKAEFLNELLQIFVDKVRAGGGKNAGRHLMVPPYCAAINLWGNKPGEINAFLDSGIKKLKINDPKNRLIVSLHYYEPYGFCMAPSSDLWYRASYDTSDDHISGNRNAVINAIKNFTNNNIPVVMGETGVTKDKAEDERVKWADDYVKQVRALGVSVVIWDDGGSFKLLDRGSRTWVYPNLVTAFVNAAE